MARPDESDEMNRNPYVPPEQMADYMKSSVVNEKFGYAESSKEAPAPAPATSKPQAKKPAAKPKRK